MDEHCAPAASNHEADAASLAVLDFPRRLDGVVKRVAHERVEVPRRHEVEAGAVGDAGQRDPLPAALRLLKALPVTL